MSGITNPAATASSGSGASGLTTGGATGGTTGGTTTSSSNDDDIILERTFLPDPSWPADLILDGLKSNWEEWNRRLNFVVDQRNFSYYLDGTLLCPDAALHSKAARNWKSSDRALRAFIFEHISESDYSMVNKHTTSHDVYKALCSNHQFQGLHAQVHVIKEALDTRFSPAVTPYSHTLNSINKLHEKFIKMGKMDDDKLKIILIMNALSDNCKTLQTAVNEMLQNPLITSVDVKNRILREEQLLIRNNGLPETTALAATNNRNARPICANCKRPNHRSEFCIAPGGAMAGKTIDEARAAQDAARGTQRGNNTSRLRNNRIAGLPPPPPAANTTASTPAPSPAATVTVNGQCYVLKTDQSPVPAANAQTALPAVSMADYDKEEYIAVLACSGDLRASVDWATHTRAVDSVAIAEQTVSSTRHSPLTRSTELPFIFDTGATCHISPEASDFKNLRSIPRHPVKGLSSANVYAVGIGDIELRIAGGHTLRLTDALYIPETSVRLISIHCLNKSSNYRMLFDINECYVLNRSNTILARGSISASRRLYVLSGKPPLVQHQKKSYAAVASETALHARVANVETWHRRLGHCNAQAIIDMAKGGVTEGMQIDLSTHPAKCDHCALGKQTRTAVPKTRENAKATKRLERVYVDLCGPMAVTSRAGNVYSMNLIDDFSGYVWTVPLRSKASAFHAIQIWHKAVTVQTGETLRILISDNGELASNSMREWCQTEGIDHQLTAPYTSAHNGRAERLHRTILNKARTMRLACNAPGFLWDEFCATAAYLTNLTGAKANLGRTPFELWFDRKPSLSHLREIGCRTFCLQHPSPSKIYARSTPSILIGYAPHSKAYRLWDPASSRVFNSFHVSFTEHLDAEPSPLHPGTVLGTAEAPSPPSWDVSGPAPSPVPDHRPPSPFSSLPESYQYFPNEHNEPSSHHNKPPPLTITPPSPNETPDIQQTTVDNDPTDVQRTNLDNDNTPELDLPDRPPPSTRPLTITIPPRPLPRRSPRLQALANNPPPDYSAAFLSEYSPVRDTHDLLPADLPIEELPPSVEEVLAALSDGSLQPVVDPEDEPLWAHAMASNEREYWIAGGRDELKSLADLKVFVLVPRSDLPRGQRPLRGKLVCKRKRDDTGRVVRYKVRYVAKGFAQRYGIDYDKTTAPTVRLESFRTILHITASMDWDLKQFDIKTAFLHGVLPEDETMFMEQPPGFEAPGKEEWVMKLMKSIYGMKQASRIWNQTFHKAVTEWGFKRIQCEWCVYRRDSPTGTVIFALHVDDILATASTPEETSRFSDFLKTKWEITELGEPKYALGIAITRDRSLRTISLSQTAKIDKLVEEYNQTNARSVDTPMVAGLQLRKPDKSTPVPSEITDWAARTPYRSLVGSLMYLAVATRPDISYAVGRLSSFLDDFRLEHWEAAIRVLRYLKSTRSLGLTLGGRNPLAISGYSDSDYANCVDTSRSIGGYCFTLGSGMISWSSRKQTTMADSSCYAEYIALHSAAHEVVFLRQLLEGLCLLPSTPAQLLCDNDAASRLSEDHVWHSHTKHIRVKYHYTRELVLAGDVTISRVGSKDNTADILTKPLARADFQRLRHYLGIRPVSTDG